MHAARALEFGSGIQEVCNALPVPAGIVALELMLMASCLVATRAESVILIFVLSYAITRRVFRSSKNAL
jgi:hypothetical protein